MPTLLAVTQLQCPERADTRVTRKPPLSQGCVPALLHGLKLSGSQGSRELGIQGSRDPGSQGPRDPGIQGARDPGIQGSSIPVPALAGALSSEERPMSRMQKS